MDATCMTTSACTHTHMHTHQFLVHQGSQHACGMKPQSTVQHGRNMYDHQCTHTHTLPYTHQFLIHQGSQHACGMKPQSTVQHGHNMYDHQCTHTHTRTHTGFWSTKAASMPVVLCHKALSNMDATCMTISAHIHTHSHTPTSF